MACVLNWVAQHQGLAAWAQAFGSILAVIVAISVPLRLKRNDDRRIAREKLLMGRSLAVTLLPEVETVRRGAEKYLRRLSAQPDTFVEADEFRLFIPAGIAHAADRLHLMGERACGAVQALIFHLHDYDKVLESDEEMPDTELVVTAANVVLEASLQASAALHSVGGAHLYGQ